MPEKGKFFDRIMSRRGLTKFDTSFLSNDGGKYSPSIRRLRQHYLHDAKVSLSKPCSSPTPSRILVSQTDDSPLSSSYHQSSIDLMATPLKCDDCQKHDGLFQCCHCNQRLCIRCCNKHYKKVTAELEYIHELNDCLLTKIIHTKNDLERQKTDSIEQCHQWRIDTINTINKAHTLIIQTIHNEYEILDKEYQLFVDKEMLQINMDKNELLRMKKGNLGSLLSSPSSTMITIDPAKSIDMIKQRIETFATYIDQSGKLSFEVKLPTFIIDETLRVESRFGDITRSTSATWQNEDFLHDTQPTHPNEISKQKSSPNSQSIKSSLLEGRMIKLSHPSSNKKVFESHHDHDDSTDETISSSTDNPYDDCFPLSTDQLHSLTTNHHLPSNHHRTNDDHEDTYQSIQHIQLQHEPDGSLKGLSIQLEKSQQNDGFIEQQRTCMEAYGIRRQTAALPLRKSSTTDRSSNDYPWLYYRSNSSPSFIQ